MLHIIAYVMNHKEQGMILLSKQRKVFIYKCILETNIRRKNMIST